MILFSIINVTPFSITNATPKYLMDLLGFKVLIMVIL